jgi:hypothetical protein
VTPQEYSDLATEEFEKAHPNEAKGTANYFSWKAAWLAATCAEKDAQIAILADLMIRAADIINMTAEELKAFHVVRGQWKLTHDEKSIIGSYSQYIRLYRHRYKLKALAKALRRRSIAILNGEIARLRNDIDDLRDA